jgi:DNA ligase-associated putative exonuclease
VNIDITSTGLYVSEADLWLDPARKKAQAFISHGHADHARARHEHILCTAATAEALRIRFGEIRTTELEFGQPLDFHGCRVTLYPAGHVLGSAQLLVECGGQRLVYTGDFKLRESLTCPAGVVVPADVLIIEATYGLPIFRFPPADESRREIVRFARGALAEGKTPVLLGYSLGKGPEITKILDEAGIPTLLHESVYQMLEVYVAAGVEFRHPIRFDPAQVDGRAVVAPPQARRERWMEAIARPAVAMVTGFAMLDRTWDRADADACICLSDHADWTELLAYVEGSGASRVLVTHGHCDALADHLRLKGIEAAAVHFPRPADGE